VEEEMAKGNTHATTKQLLPIGNVAKRFLAWNIFMDMTSAKNYLCKAVISE